MEFYNLSNTKLIEGFSPLFDSKSESGIDMLHEWAARTCYHSLDRFCTDIGFLNRVYSKGHVDVFEHGMFQLAIDEVKDLDALKLMIHQKSPYARVKTHSFLFDEKLKHLRVNASFRVWADLASSGIFDEDGLQQIREILFSGAPHSCMWESKEFQDPQPTRFSSPGPKTFELSTGAKVSLVAKQASLDSNFDDQASATIYFDGVSRAFTHQLVRHRRGSFSQESQRYVRLNKTEGEFDLQFVVPPKVDKEKFVSYCQDAVKGYYEMLEAGVAPEDARFILPQAMRTRIVMTMTMDDWKHFIWLRALDKAAQWEIREGAQAVLRLFEHHAYPFFLNEIRHAYNSGIFDKSNDFHSILVLKPIIRLIDQKRKNRKEAAKYVHSN